MEEGELVFEADDDTWSDLIPSPPLPSPPQSGVLPSPLHGDGAEGRSVHPHSEVRPAVVGYAHGSPMLTWYAHSGKAVVTLW